MAAAEAGVEIVVGEVVEGVSEVDLEVVVEAGLEAVEDKMVVAAVVVVVEEDVAAIVAAIVGSAEAGEHLEVVHEPGLSFPRQVKRPGSDPF